MKKIKRHSAVTLLKKMQQLGYDVNADGVCAGYTMVALESLINHGDIKEFDRLIKFICNDFNPEKNSSNNRLFPPNKDKITLDALATLDQIQLYQNPEIYNELFTQTVSQHESHKITPLAQSNKSIANQGFITNDDWSWSGMYDSNTLESLLNDIKNATIENQTLAFKIASIEHKIALGYKNGTWILTDINHMPSITCTSIRKLAKKLIKFLGIEKSNTICISITAFSAGINKTQTQNFIDHLYESSHFRTQHTISTALISHHDITHLAQLAICNHQDNLLSDLILQGINVNAITPSGFSLVYLAAQYGFTSTLELLIKAGAQVNSSEGKHGFSPLLVATQYQHHDAISLLIKHGATISAANNDQITPLMMAANNGDIETLKILTKSGAKLNENTLFGTPAQMARNAGKADAASYIEKQLGISD